MPKSPCSIVILVGLGQSYCLAKPGKFKYIRDHNKAFTFMLDRKFVSTSMSELSTEKISVISHRKLAVSQCREVLGSLKHY